MNTNAMNLSPVNTIQPPQAAAKQSESATPDAPFCQVLSNELAQNRKGEESSKNSDANTDADSETRASAPSETGTVSAAEIKELKETRKAHHPLDQQPTDNAAALAIGLPVVVMQPDTAKQDPVNPDDAIATLADAAHESKSLGAATDKALGTVTNKALSPLALPDGQFPGKASSEQKLTGNQAEKSGIQMAASNADSRNKPIVDSTTHPDTNSSTKAIDNMTAVLANALPADHAGTSKLKEALPDIASQPGMATTMQGLLENIPELGKLASSRLTPSVGSNAWGQALGENLVWMAAGKQQTASLTLNPPDMGPLQIVLNVSNDHATASFFSAQPEVRHALESSLPKLREMMGDAGIQLGQATVSSDTPRQSYTPERQAPLSPFQHANQVTLAGLQTAQTQTKPSGLGLVDTYA